MILLYAEDNIGDQLLVREALWEANVPCDLRFVNDGQELVNYLYRLGGYGETNAPRPDVILLDLNMPRKSGIEALLEIKGNPFLWDIPVIVLTSSEADADVARAYEAGATAYTKKPATFSRLVRMMEAFGRWWGTVELPSSARAWSSEVRLVASPDLLRESEDRSPVTERQCQTLVG